MNSSSPTTFSREQRPKVITTKVVITDDPSVVEKAAKKFLERIGKGNFTHYTSKRTSGKSVLSLFTKEVRSSRVFTKPIDPETLRKFLPYLNDHSLFPSLPSDSEGLRRGWKISVMRDRFIMVAVWIESSI